MDDQDSPTMETPDQAVAGRAQVGWGFWALLVPAPAAVGALSYLLGAVVPLAKFTLSPAEHVPRRAFKAMAESLSQRRRP